MKISIVFDSITQNTEKLAQEIRKACVYNDVISYGDVTQDYSKADIVFVGSYTKDNSCSEKIKNFLKSVNNKKIFLFGTCGFDGTKNYYNNIYENTKKYINSTNEIVGYFYCRGEVSSEVKEQYIEKIKINKDHQMLTAFTKSISKSLEHPNEDDLFDLDKSLRKL